MSDRRTTIREAFETTEGFTVDGGLIRVDTTPFDADVSLEIAGEEITYELEANLPSLDAVTAEDVADVVLEGWADTLDRRLRDADGVTDGLADLEYEIDWDGERVDVRMRLRRSVGNTVPTDDLLALANYVDGTYLQGIIPGYTYGPPVEEMLAQARQRADEPVTDVPGSNGQEPPGDPGP